MKNTWLLAPLALLVCSAAAQEMTRLRQRYTVQRDGQELFNAPFPYAGIKSRLSAGQELDIKGMQGPWKEVEGEGLEGWVQSPPQRRYGAQIVSEEYVNDAATAPIGAGLVTKGFGEAYGRQHGTEEAAEVNAELDAQRVDFEQYETFMRSGGLPFADYVVAEAAPQDAGGGEGAGETGAAGAGGSGASQGEPRRVDRDERENPYDDLRRGMDRKREGLKMAQDPLYFTRNLSYEAEHQMGLAVGQRLAAGRIYEDEVLQRYVSLIGAAVTEHCDRNNIPYRFIVLESDEVNAFAAPGGFIFVTTGCIRACRNEAELAGVIAHEVAHVARRHALRTMDKHKLQIQKQMAAAEMDRTIEKYLGPMDPETASLVKKLRSLADESYKYCTGGWGQEFELEADAYGLRYAAIVGWDHSGLIGFLHTLEAGEQVSLGEAFRTHPPAAKRIAALEGLVREHSIPSTGNLNRDRFLEYTASLRE